VTEPAGESAHATTTLPAHLRPATRGTMAPFWDAAARGELHLPRCGHCRTWSWPPRPCCPVCSQSALGWAAASGAGVVHTFTVVRQVADPWLAARAPYAVAMIELAEGPRIMSHVTGCAADDVHIGMRVRVAFVDAGDGLSLPVFTPVDESP
jgi:uncharacterized OB-fold protein